MVEAFLGTAPKSWKLLHWVATASLLKSSLISFSQTTSVLAFYLQTWLQFRRLRLEMSPSFFVQFWNVKTRFPNFSVGPSPAGTGTRLTKWDLTMYELRLELVTFSMSSEGYWWLYVLTGGGSCQSACSVHVTTPRKGKYFRACVGLGLLNGALGKSPLL